MIVGLVLADGRARSSKKEKSKSVGVGENNIMNESETRAEYIDPKLKASDRKNKWYY